MQIFLSTCNNQTNAPINKYFSPFIVSHLCLLLLVSAHDLRPLWSLSVSLNLVPVLVFLEAFDFFYFLFLCVFYYYYYFVIIQQDGHFIHPLNRDGQ
jgi:hypothetical protein